MPPARRPQTPFIVTLVIDDPSHAWFNRLRTEHFPPERLLVGAHITMFHALPREHENLIRAALATEAAKTPAFPIAVTGTRFLGRGVAYTLAAPQAEHLRATLASTFAPHLTPQDSAPWRPHITIQNKVKPEVARQTQSMLGALTTPSTITAQGFSLWSYQNGPWEHVKYFEFIM